MAITTMTWRDIKLATLQKMFAAEGSTIPTDGSTEDYIAAMPYVANEGIHRLVTVGKPIAKQFTIAHYPWTNLLGDDFGMKIYSLKPGDTFEFGADHVGSVFMQHAGTFDVEIYENEVLESASRVTSPNEFAFDALRKCPQAEDTNVRFVITAYSDCAFKNIAFYKPFMQGAEDEIPAYSEYVDYNLRDVCPDGDYYRLYSDQLYLDDGTKRRRMPQADYRLVGGHTLSIRRDRPGGYVVNYQAYPATITAATADDEVIDLDPELVVLLPTYMAAELYKDDDNGIATTYRNEFEVALEGVQQGDYEEGHESFHSESGWI